MHDKIELMGIYDSGSNVSLINSKFLKFKTEKQSNKKSARLLTINGAQKTKGMVTLKIKIFDIEKIVDIFVVNKDNFKYDFLIGLDMIQKFQLIQNEKLEIKQRKFENIMNENSEKNRLQSLRNV